MTGEVTYFYYDHSRSDFLQTLIDAEDIESDDLKITALGDTMSQAEHAAAVAKVKQDIIDGKVFQCEVGFKKRFRIEGDTVALYDQLRTINPSPQMYYMKFGDQKLVGASPSFSSACARVKWSCSAAGTTTRGQTPQEDTQLARTLLNDPKEIAEHNMIVDDIAMNIVGCPVGTVRCAA